MSLDWETFSSYVGGIMVLDDFGIPLEGQQQQMISMDPPRHDRIKALFQRGFTPKRIAEHEERIRGIVNRVLDRVEDRDEVDLVNEVAGPVVSRVIGSFIGTPEEDDQRHMEETNMVLGFGDEDLRPTEEAVVEMMTRAWNETMELIAERRDEPGHERPHGRARPLRGRRREALRHRDLHGPRAARRRRQRQHPLGLHQRDARPVREPRPARAAARRPGADPEGAVEELLRMYPAFAHFRRTATRDVELHGETIREGDKVLLWYVSSNRDEAVYEDPQRLDVTRRPDHQAFGAGGRHFCLGAALARLEIKTLLSETLRRFPRHRARRRAGQGPLAVPEPAEDAAGSPQRVGAVSPGRAPTGWKPLPFSSEINPSALAPAPARARHGADAFAGLEALEVALLERAVDEPGLDVLRPARALLRRHRGSRCRSAARRSPT